MQVQPYLMFDGRGEEAIEFYRGALGAEVQMLMRFKDCPEPEHRPSSETANKVMHASLRIGDSTVMLSDRDARESPSTSRASRCRSRRVTRPRRSGCSARWPTAARCSSPW
jgi:uncharacterized glyoxalase superfamily protein PhnB